MQSLEYAGIKENDKVLISYFREILPNFDEDRVYTSNIKKVLQWYNLLASKNFDFTAIKEEEEETDEDDEFICETCSTVQGKNNCELCDVEDVCEECQGQGGDYGPNEIWVCHECLPTCLECEAPLYTTYDECCGKGRSDEEK